MIYGPFISYSQAREQGLRHYFTGKPCKRNHVAPRRTKDSTCVECNKIHLKAWKKSDKGKASEARRRAAKQATALGAATANARVCTQQQFSSVRDAKNNGYLPNKTTGISREALRIYFQTLFREGMTWDNYGEAWQVDHIRPISSFDLADPAQFSFCFSWMNLQPLTREENIAKGETWTPSQRDDWLRHLKKLGYTGPTY